MKSNFISASALGALVLIASCKKSDNPPSIPPYTVPETYNFDNVEYQEPAALVSMWAAYTGNLGRSNIRQLSQDSINRMWTNSNSPFAAETGSNLPYNYDALNGFAFNLAAKTADAAAFKVLADSMVSVSQYYNTPASKGVAGKIGSRIFNYRGYEFNQGVAKGLMGGLVLHNINAILDKISTDDNNTVVPGKGTAMQHNWDLAFGYVGIPKADFVNRAADTIYAFPNTNSGRPLAIGGYFRERGVYIKSGQKVYDAFIKGRAAIGAKDYMVRDEAIATIKEFLEKTLAAAGYYYVTASQTQTDLAAKFHSLSEGQGFALALKYRPANSKLTAENYNKLVAILASDFYELAEDATNTKLKEAQSLLTAAYGQLQAQPQ